MTFNLLVLLTSLSFARSEIPPVKELPKDRIAERELSGIPHRYRLHLRPMQFARIEIDKIGVDIVVRIYNPGGTKVLEMNGPDETDGTEPVSVLSEMQEADYLIELLKVDKNARPGKYRIKLIECRDAVPTDTDYIAAQSAFAAGMHLLNAQDDEPSRREGIARLQQSLKLWGKENAEPFRMAQALHGIGYAWDLLSDERQAIESYKDALRFWATADYPRGEARTLSSLGAAYVSLGEYDEGLGFFNSSLPLRRKAADLRGEAWTLSNIVSATTDLGDLENALNRANDLLPIWRELNDKNGESHTLNEIGIIYARLGESESALTSFNQVIDLCRAAHNRDREATALTNIGRMYASRGDPKQALEYFEQALQLRVLVGDRYGQAYTLQGIGSAYRDLRETSKALGSYKKALALNQQVGDRRGEAESLTALGLILDLDGDSAQALTNLNRALLLRQQTKDSMGEASARYSMARIENKLQEWDQALQNLKEAIQSAESARTRLTNLSHRTSYFSTVHDYFGAYINVLMQLNSNRPAHGYADEALTISERAKARVLLEMLREGNTEIRRGVDPALLARRQSLSRRLDGKTDYQTRLLSGPHTEKEAAKTAQELTTILSELEGTDARIRQISPYFTSLMQPQPLSAYQIRKSVVDGDTVLLEYYLGEDQSYLWAVSSDATTSFALPKRSEIEAAAQRFLMLLTARGLKITGEAAQDRNLRIRRADQAYWPAAVTLSKMVLGPAYAAIAGKRLLVVPDGILNYIPFTALPDETERLPLLAGHAVVNIPSASTLGLLREKTESRPVPSRLLAVFADPVFEETDSRLPHKPRTNSAGARERSLHRSAIDLGLTTGTIQLPRLPFTRVEAQAIASGSGSRATSLALDFDATRDRILGGELREYRMIHFATHGLINNVHPELSGLVFSLFDRSGNHRSGFLKLEDVYNLSLAADLVVLSACRTGLGKDSVGEGLVGLTRGFMYAGARRVVASLWDVDDVGTARLMEKFYNFMLEKHLEPVEALRQAQLNLWSSKRWSNPYYWAAFSFQGDWK